MITDRRSVLRWLGIGAAATPVVGAGIIASVSDAQKAFANELPRGFGDPYHVPDQVKKPDMVYNWKRVFITAEEPDFENCAAMIKQGWKPVARARYPKLPAYEMRPGTADSNVNVFAPAWVEIGGLVLMEKAIGA